jgi:uncharacterized transporter YbjL
MREIIAQSEPLLLFLVIGFGFLLGQLQIRGFKLGVAGVLFAGPLFGGWRPGEAEPLTIAGQVMQLGLILFVYTVGLTLLLLRYLGKATIVSAIGATSGMQTQPATLARAYEMSQSDETYIAYATTYPVAMVGKILIAQLLLLIAAALR